MPGGDSGDGSGRSSGGSSVASGRKASRGMSAKARYKLKQATKRWNEGKSKYMPTDYAPKFQRRRDR